MALEPVAGQVYFSPECHAAYAELGFAPSPGSLGGRVELPDGPAYFTSRGSVMGQVPGQVVAAAFAVFNPAAIVPAVEFGWSQVDAATICAARTRGAVAQLVRILGAEPPNLERVTELLQAAVAPLRPEGKPLFAGLSSLGLPGEPVADAWRLADVLREYRGDAHTAAWTALYWGLPMRSYIRTRAWSDADLDAAEQRLVARGLVADGRLTDNGRALRESVEVATDEQCAVIVEVLAERLDELIDLLAPWGAAIRDAGGYPSQGPHDLAPAR
jgi:helix-turn-helix protein